MLQENAPTVTFLPSGFSSAMSPSDAGTQSKRLNCKTLGSPEHSTSSARSHGTSPTTLASLIPRNAGSLGSDGPCLRALLFVSHSWDPRWEKAQTP